MSGCMAIVVIKCPNTGKYVPTRIEVDLNCFEPLDHFQSPAQCTHCGEQHAWSKYNARPVSPGIWSMEPRIEACFLRADEHADRAKYATSTEQREFHLRMERKWLRIADRWIMLQTTDME